MHPVTVAFWPPALVCANPDVAAENATTKLTMAETSTPTGLFTFHLLNVAIRFLG
jgi:hypothetical protein